MPAGNAEFSSTKNEAWVEYLRIPALAEKSSLGCNTGDKPLYSFSKEGQPDTLCLVIGKENLVQILGR